ncbi:MAG TPA: hypothetical protein PLQ67_06790, partial [Burkholderiaceae bacterium]|nr:hypothetical protein [Burkholderiaceae bacterium]
TAMLFGHGQLQELLGTTPLASMTAWLPLSNTPFDAVRFILFESLVVICTLLAVGLTASELMRDTAPRWRLLGGLLLSALAARATAWALHFGSARAFDWLTPGAMAGLIAGAGLLAAALKTPRRLWPAGAALAALALSGLVNATPPNPFFSDWLSLWRPGQTTHLVELGRWLSAAWPYLLVLALGIQAWRHRGR